MIKNIITLSILLAGLSLLFSGCDNNTIFNEKKDIPNYVWNKDNRVSFEFEITDTASVYDVILDLRHTNFYPFSNIWLMVYTTYPDNPEPSSQRLELTLADKDGRWKGECIGDICDDELYIQENAFFDKPGKYGIAFDQIMRTDDLATIMSVGLRIVKTGPKPEKTAQPDEKEPKPQTVP